MIKEDFNFAYVGGTDLVSSGLGAVSWLYFAYLASVDDYGQVAFLISISGIAFTLSSLGLSQTVLTFMPKGRPTILREVNSLLLLSTFGAGLVVGFISINPILAILVVSLATYQMSTTQLLAMTKHREYGIISIGNKVTQISLSLSLYFIMGIDGFILGYALSNFAFSYRFVSVLRQFTLRFQELRKEWKFSTHIAISTIASSMRSQWDKILIGLLLGSYVLGSYQFAFQFYLVLALMAASFSKYLLPHESAGVIKRKFKFTSIVLISVFAGIIIICVSFAVPILYPEFSGSILAIQVMCLAIIPHTLSTLVSVRIMAQNTKIHHLMLATIIGNVVYLSLIAYLGPTIGVTGLALALLIGISTHFTYIMIRFNRQIF